MVIVVPSASRAYEQPASVSAVNPVSPVLGGDAGASLARPAAARRAEGPATPGRSARRRSRRSPDGPIIAYARASVTRRSAVPGGWSLAVLGPAGGDLLPRPLAAGGRRRGTGRRSGRRWRAGAGRPGRRPGPGAGPGRRGLPMRRGERAGGLGRAGLAWVARGLGRPGPWPAASRAGLRPGGRRPARRGPAGGAAARRAASRWDRWTSAPGPGPLRWVRGGRPASRPAVRRPLRSGASARPSRIRPARPATTSAEAGRAAGSLAVRSAISAASSVPPGWLRHHGGRPGRSWSR